MNDALEPEGTHIAAPANPEGQAAEDVSSKPSEVVGPDPQEAFDQLSLPERFAKTIVYWPLEHEHVEENPRWAYALFLAWIIFGVVTATYNVFFALALTLGGVYGAALARYLVRGKDQPAVQQSDETGG